MKKNIIKVVMIIVCACLVCGLFYFVRRHFQTSAENGTNLTDVQKITTRDLDKEYPETPREVIKLFNNILTCYYNKSYTDKELRGMTDCAWGLFDTELQQQNPQDDYYASVQLEVEEYKKNKKTINQSKVCDSDDVVYKTDPDNGDELAYVNTYYFMKENGKFDKVYEMYVLRKDEESRWKILVFYQIEGKSSEED